MIARYIDAEQCDEIIEQFLWAYDTTELKEMLRYFPTADVTEVKHGKFVGKAVEVCDWSGKSQKYYEPYTCSCCHAVLKGTDKFCSNCGAKMDGGK